MQAYALHLLLRAEIIISGIQTWNDLRITGWSSEHITVGGFIVMMMIKHGELGRLLS